MTIMTDYSFIRLNETVFWTDPDRDISTGEYQVSAIHTDEGEPILSDTIIYLTNGLSIAEVPAHELTPC